MSKIFAIRNDGFKFQELVFPITDLLNALPAGVDQRLVMKYHFNNISMSEWWPELEIAFKPAEDLPTGAIPDICEWRGGSLVLSQKAFDQLHQNLANYGEFLPLKFGSEDYYLFNCLTLAQVDEINSQKNIQDGVYMGINKIAFNTIDVSDKEIFKTKFDRCTVLYCHQSVKDIIVESGLTGVVVTDDLVETFE